MGFFTTLGAIILVTIFVISFIIDAADKTNKGEPLFRTPHTVNYILN